jgi:hypothetical protein
MEADEFSPRRHSVELTCCWRVDSVACRCSDSGSESDSCVQLFLVANCALNL